MTDRDAARRTARHILTQAGHAVPRIPPIAEMANLARDYLDAVGDGTADRRGRRLADAGPVYVSTEAARKYADHSAAEDLDGARLELTAIAQDAAETATPGEWRIARRGVVDIEMRVSRDLVAGQPVCVVREVMVHRGLT